LSVPAKLPIAHAPLLVLNATTGHADEESVRDWYTIARSLWEIHAPPLDLVIRPVTFPPDNGKYECVWEEDAFPSINPFNTLPCAADNESDVLSDVRLFCIPLHVLVSVNTAFEGTDFPKV